VYTARGQKRVYALIDTGSEETLISKKLYTELSLEGVPLEVLLITADGNRSLISSMETSFHVGPVDDALKKFKINSALVLDNMPSIEKNFPTASNLECFEHASDLVRDNKFPCLVDESLHLIIGVREANLINYDKVRTPVSSEQPFLAHCKIGWTAYGPDPGLRNKPLTRCNLVRCADEILEKKIDTLLHESFAERPHDFNCAPSVNDKIVLNDYKNSIESVGDRFEIALPFKKKMSKFPIIILMR
jgi:hypothetical protein